MCTAIKIDYDGGAVLGRTMDLEPPLNYNILYYPRGYKFSQDLFGQDLHGKYKVLGVCFNDRNPIKDGVNEHGLIGVTNDYGGFNLYSNQVEKGRTNLSSLDYLSYALSNYKSLDELLEDLPNIHLSTRNHKNEKVLNPVFHYMFTDPSKRSIVIEPSDKKLLAKENPYDVMTNSPALGSHVRRLEKIMDPDNLKAFNSAKNLPGGYDPVSRFIKAFYLTRMNEPSKTYGQALANIYTILGTMTLPKGFIKTDSYSELTHTFYTSVYDTASKSLTIKSIRSPEVFKLGFQDIEGNSSERQAIFLEDLE
ncbi:MAG: linear amide C-N hydrolase [Tissierellia bacterium]|nr:linear amide C-N hydrolase [Tissierellia bacterium]